jgi:hypothetical protein
MSITTDIYGTHPHTISVMTADTIAEFKLRILKNRGNPNPDGITWMIPNVQEEHFDEELFTI